MSQSSMPCIERGSLTAFIREPVRPAAIVGPVMDEPWRDELTAVVESGDLDINRIEFTGDVDAIADLLDRHVPSGPISRGGRDAFLSDVLDLVQVAEEMSASRTMRLRILTEQPNRRCGFHVDTVPPGAPSWGLLRVYNGEGTRWVPPEAVRSMGSFYDWLHRRDRVVRDQAHDLDERDAHLAAVDEHLDFLTDRSAISVVPSGARVVLRHLPADQHWSDHPVGRAWIHCSPMSGRRRLVVNVNPDRLPR